jgi:hypothetical protein
MKKFVLCVLIVLAGCKGEENIKDQGIDQAWLDKEIDEINKSDLKQYFYIVKAKYNGQCIVYVSNCCPMCLSTIVPFTCDGTRVENVDLMKIDSHEIIWKPDNYSCSL